jgi:hypothetical protein
MPARVADMAANGIWLVSAQDFKLIRFVHTGARQLPLTGTGQVRLV